MKRKAFTTIIVILLLLALAAGVYFSIQNIRDKNRKARVREDVTKTEGYLKAEEGSILLYTCKETIEEDFLGRIASREVIFSEAKEVPRGTIATLVDWPETDEEGNILYERYLIDGEEYFAKPGHFTKDLNEVVSEKTRYVRTHVTIY